MTKKFTEVLQEATAGMPVKLSRNSSCRVAKRVPKSCLLEVRELTGKLSTLVLVRLAGKLSLG